MDGPHQPMNTQVKRTLANQCLESLNHLHISNTNNTLDSWTDCEPKEFTEITQHERTVLITWIDNNVTRLGYTNKRGLIQALIESFIETDYHPLARVCCDILIDEYQDSHHWLNVTLNRIASQYEQAELHLKAIQVYKSIVDLKIESHTALNRIGLIFLSVQKYRQALNYLTQALTLEPEFSNALLNLGVVYQNLDDPGGALVCFRKCIEINPNDANAHYNLGITQFAIGQVQECLTSFKRALYFNSCMASAHYNLGVAYSQLKHHSLAAEHFFMALILDPSHALINYNIGVSYFDVLDYKDAIKYYKRALHINPSHIESHWNLSHAYLIQQNLTLGFTHYEWRWLYNEIQYRQAQREFSAPLWLGQNSLHGKALLIHAEQGLGDTLQFIRYVHNLKDEAADIVLEVQPALSTLIKTSFPNLRVYARGETLPVVDYHIPMMSLPHALAVQEISTQGSYLKTQPMLDAHWLNLLNQRLESTSTTVLKSTKRTQHMRKRVGLVWSSGYRKDQVETWERNIQRNIPLYMLMQLFELPIDFISLQMGEFPSKELALLREMSPSPVQLMDLSTEIKDFSDTASIVRNLDLVISVDTSVAHLSAALGTPTWIPLKTNACWRWFLGSDKSPWYPSVKLFRQEHSGQWESVVANLHKALIKLLDE
jgi:tetratricopeptide (TPR) repeat protein